MSVLSHSLTVNSLEQALIPDHCMQLVGIMQGLEVLQCLLGIGGFVHELHAIALVSMHRHSVS